MQIKTRRPIQILTLTLALSMLTAYIVYSQRERNRTVAPGLKIMPLSDPAKTSDPSQTLITNPPGMVAPGSKSMAPILHVQPPPAKQSTPIILNSAAAGIAPGSKSGQVFNLQQREPIRGVKPNPSQGAQSARNSAEGGRP
jgi:hypothetical protein